MGLVLGQTEPSEEGSDGFEEHDLALHLFGVFARLPLVEGRLFDYFLVVKCVKEHPHEF